MSATNTSSASASDPKKKASHSVVKWVLAGVLISSFASVLVRERHRIPLEPVEANAEHDAVEGSNNKFKARVANIGDRVAQDDPEAINDLAIARLTKRDEEERIKGVVLRTCSGRQVEQATIPTPHHKLMDPGDILWFVSGGCKAGQLVGAFYVVTPTVRDVYFVTVEGGVSGEVPELSPVTVRDKAVNIQGAEDFGLAVSEHTFLLDGWVNLKVSQSFDRGVYVLYKKR